MGMASQIVVKPIAKKDADLICQKLHYSGKYCRASQLNLGVFYQGGCHGVMQFGPSTDKGKIQPIVKDTPWNGFIELNRMAFDDVLPKNSESRALGYAFRLIKKNYPQIKWVISFSDATQSGDGAIYRATGFVLTQINKNKSLWRLPNGEVIHALTLTNSSPFASRHRIGMGPTETVSSFMKRVGGQIVPGFQLRYIKFLDESFREKLNGKAIPFSEIDRMGARMHRGNKICAGSKDVVASGFQSEEEGSNPISALQKLS